MEIDNVDEIASSIAEKVTTQLAIMVFAAFIGVLTVDFLIDGPPAKTKALRDLAGWTAESRPYLQPIVIEGKPFRINNRSGDMCELTDASASSPDKTPSAELEKLLKKSALDNPTYKPQDHPSAKPESCFLADKKA